jgi:hypothetical protein
MWRRRRQVFGHRRQQQCQARPYDGAVPGVPDIPCNDHSTRREKAPASSGEATCGADQVERSAGRGLEQIIIRGEGRALILALILALNGHRASATALNSSIGVGSSA